LQIEEIKEKFIHPYGFEKIYDVVAGGKERQDSVYNGLLAIPDETEFIVIHDAVRPFVTTDIISRVLKAAQESGAAVAGIPVSDTVKRAAENRSIISTEDRHFLWLAQTPQIFRRDIITKAYQQAYEDHYYGTDDSVMVERLGLAVHMVHGSPFNIKITTHEDMIMGMAVLKIPGRDSLAP
jgi:2-C-methyl-D-erythritol 4-phosphate cytidylyltransferase